MVTAALLALTPASVLGAGPWQWQMTLRGDTPENSLLHPSSVYIDEQRERYYVVDTGNNRLMSFDISGKPLSALTADDQLRSPFDMVRDKKGRLLVVEKGRNSLTLIDLRAKEVVRNSISYKDETVYIDRVESDGDKVFILDKSSGDIFELNNDFEVVRNFGCDTCSFGFVDFKITDDSIWALEQNEQTIYQFDKSGTLHKKIALQQGVVSFPRSFAVGRAGRFYVMGRHSNTIAVFDERGTYKYSFFSTGQANGQLLFPVELRFDPWGRLCVVEEGNGRVQIFTRQ
jgi:DNA-binding beta-propeller fold protein YncE